MFTKFQISSPPHTHLFLFQGNVSLVYRFFVGYNEDLQVEELREEMSRFDDIVYVDTPDTYRTNYRKMYAMHEWHRAFCPEADFFVKQDDDTVPLFRRFLQWAALDFDGRTRGKKDFLVCEGTFHNVPDRVTDNKW